MGYTLHVGLHFPYLYSSEGRKRGRAAAPEETAKKSRPEVSVTAQPQLTTLFLQDWTVDLQGFWQTQPRDFVLEKAFNEVVSQQGTRCCVCCMFEWSSPYTSWSRQELDRRAGTLRTLSKVQARPLKVVVQRALVHLPPSLTDSGSDDKLLVCDKCSITVHKCEAYVSLWLLVSSDCVCSVLWCGGGL